MKITRKIETANAQYNLEEINEEQFTFLLASVNHYSFYTHHCIPDKIYPIGELVNKLERMKESSITIIN